MVESSRVNQISSERSLIVATAGHVDHGKTALIDRITGTNTDTLQEEKERGLSINLGYAYFHYSSSTNNQSFENTIGFVDVPGHSDFINNMLAGVGTVDYALLVIAADDGIMPQTREHLAILDLLGISSGLVALSKIDKCDDQRIESVSKEICDLLSPTSMRDSPIFPISNITGAGIESLINHLQLVLADKVENRDLYSNHFTRFLVDRSFTVKGAGTVVTGSVRAGLMRAGDSILHSGTAQQTRIRGLRQDTADIEIARAGQRAAANIGINADRIRRGDWLIDPQIYKPVLRFDATINLIDAAFELRSSAQYHLFIGAAHHIVTIRCLDSTQQDLYQVASHETMIAHYGDRFVLRDPASQITIGGGKVIDIFIPRRKRSSESRLQALRALNNDSTIALDELLRLSSLGVDLEQFVICRNLNLIAVEELFSKLKARNRTVVKLRIENRKHPTLLDEEYFLEYASQIFSGLEHFHSDHSNQQGISEPALSKAVSFEGSHLLFHAVLQAMINDATIKRTGTLLHLPDHVSILSQEEQQFLGKVRPLLIKAGNVPPRTRELVELTGIPLRSLEQILKQVTLAGNLIKVADNRYYLPETIMALAELTEQLANSSSIVDGFSVIQFRDTSGIGRNLCIEILEYFDRIGFTRRDGNSRFIRTEKENIFGR
ncbi:MAG: selenocysteine-specific translation elongation factor [Proteobacteria bacterium]|nr:selenocysteine-specific translation elongation factor [Pseudomonadota bacterium]